MISACNALLYPLPALHYLDNASVILDESTVNNNTHMFRRSRLFFRAAQQSDTWSVGLDQCSPAVDRFLTAAIDRKDQPGRADAELPPPVVRPLQRSTQPRKQSASDGTDTCKTSPARNPPVLQKPAISEAVDRVTQILSRIDFPRIY